MDSPVRIPLKKKHTTGGLAKKNQHSDRGGGKKTRTLRGVVDSRRGKAEWADKKRQKR